MRAKYRFRLLLGDGQRARQIGVAYKFRQPRGEQAKRRGSSASFSMLARSARRVEMVVT